MEKEVSGSDSYLVAVIFGNNRRLSSPWSPPPGRRKARWASSHAHATDMIDYQTSLEENKVCPDPTSG